MKRATALLLSLLLALSLAGCGGTPQQTAQGTRNDALRAQPTETPAQPAADGTAPYPAGDYGVLLSRLRETRDSRNGMVWNSPADMAVAEAMPQPTAAPVVKATADAPAGSMEPDSADFSGTNVQVAGVDEGDIVKTDGKYLYVLRDQTELLILEAAGAESRVLSRTGLYQSETQGDDADYSSMVRMPTELMLSGHILAVLSSYGSWHDYKNAAGEYCYDSEERVEIDFYDVSDPAHPVKTASLGQDGYLRASRLLGDTLYLVSSWSTWDWDDTRPETYIPRLYKAGQGTLMPADCIYVCPEDAGTDYLTVAAYDLQSGVCLGSQSLLGAGDTVYMSRDRLYVAGSQQHTDESAARRESVYTVKDYVNYSETVLHSFALEGGAPVLSASGSVPGTLESQFSMDAYGGYLRLVTTVDRSSYSVYEDEAMSFSNYRWDEAGESRSNALYVLDAGLHTVGSVADLAPGERVYSARFDGDTAYFCTFRETDPLFAVDLSQPTAPKVLSTLKISGFSEYLHGWDEGLLFGLGREADETDGRAEEMKLVMFDTGDKTDVTAAHTLLLDCDYSEALYDHKAVFISPERNIIGFQGGDRYYIYGYAPETGFFQRACLETDGAWNSRGLYIGDCAYIVGSWELLVVDMNDWTVLQRLTLTA